MANPSFAARMPALQVAEEKYSAYLGFDAQGIRVYFRGTISTVNPAVVLNPFVDAVHAHVLHLKQDMDVGRRRRLARLGFDEHSAEELSGLHTRNFM